MPALEDALRAACPALKVQERLARHTSLAIGGPADYYADVQALQELQALHHVVQSTQTPVFFIGAGSNLLVSDKGWRGLVIHLQGDFRKIDIQGERVVVGAGAWMPTVVKQCAEKGLAGIEALIGVPGTIGGGLVMNAGTRDGVLGDVVESIDTLSADSQVQTLSRNEFQFEYRRSTLLGRWITAASLRLKAEERSTIISRVESYLQYRTRTQPLATSNCGSVFKNPEGKAAAQLIEQAGLKGTQIGGARISERHANFIINEKQATAADVQALMTLAQKSVSEKFGVHLEPEVKLVGEW
jgi:UDP-N-acetylmuramate dehydrogenase